MDRYRNFRELQENETDYRIECCDRGRDITIIAPHGGRIEPHSCEIAKVIAGQDCNYYCFHGLREGSNTVLHLTSHRFDEPLALALIKTTRIAISVHGCSRRYPVILLGGRAVEISQKISENLARAGIKVIFAGRAMSGSHPDNICNRGATGRGVQLEVSRPLRDNPLAWKRIGGAVRTALQLPLE